MLKTADSIISEQHPSQQGDVQRNLGTEHPAARTAAGSGYHSQLMCVFNHTPFPITMKLKGKGF